MATPNQNLVTEEQEKRFHELNAKKDRTEEENTELGELKTNYANTAKQRIDRLTSEKKAAQERAEQAEREAEEVRTRLKEAQEAATSTQPEAIVGNENETVEIKGQKWYTDAALTAQIKANKITDQAAIDYQTKRNRTETVVAVKDELKKERETEEAQKLRLVDAQKIVEQYPHFNAKHPDHNPNDPLYKLTIELYNDGLGVRPDGLSKSVRRAKQILGIKDTQVDRSSDLGVEEGGSPADKGGKKDEEVTLTEGEEETAIAMYTRGDYINPKTGRAYTRDEAIAKAKQAKKNRRK